MTVKRIGSVALFVGGLVVAIVLTTERSGNGEPESAVALAEAELFAEDDAESFGEEGDEFEPTRSEQQLLSIRTGESGVIEALIASGSSARYYRRGETLTQVPAKLAHILDNAVLLKKGGAYQLLCCAAASSISGISADTAPAVLDLRAKPATTLTARSYHSRLYQNPISLLGTVDIQSIDYQGARHYRVFPGSDPKAFSAFGLKAGDRVVGVNGIELADAKAIPKLFGALASASYIAVTLHRGERELVVLVALDDDDVRREADKSTLL